MIKTSITATTGYSLKKTNKQAITINKIIKPIIFKITIIPEKSPLKAAHNDANINIIINVNIYITKSPFFTVNNISYNSDPFRGLNEVGTKPNERTFCIEIDFRPLSEQIIHNSYGFIYIILKLLYHKADYSKNNSSL